MASICRNFAVLGYCSAGDSCAGRHVFECPDYASTGTCRRHDCRLPHVDRAGQIRQHTGMLPSCPHRSSLDRAENADESDILSAEETEESGSDDVDSEDLADDLRPLKHKDRLLQQDDYVRL